MKDQMKGNESVGRGNERVGGMPLLKVLSVFLG